MAIEPISTLRKLVRRYNSVGARDVNSGLWRAGSRWKGPAFSAIIGAVTCQRERPFLYNRNELPIRPTMPLL